MKLLPPSGGGVGELRRHVIAAMCNLLSANIESGMGHVMSESGGRMVHFAVGALYRR